MAEGLKPHRHQYYLHETKKYYDRNKDCNVKKDIYRCMICGQETYELYEHRPPPMDKTKSLEKNKRKYSNQR